jgi:hypothetical protein
VNYFAHGLRFLDRPWFLAGTAVPDWLCVADRRVRVRPRLVAPLLEEDGEAGSEIAAGILQHFHDDQWFHSTRGFAQTTAELTAQFRAVLGPADDWRPSFLGHVVTELLLDAVLIARRPEQLDEYYAALMKIDPERVQGVVNRASRNSTERLAPLIPLFVRERFLYDYVDAGRLLDRLNAVLRRVKLAPLPEAVIPVLDAGRELVAGRVDELLPPRHWGRGVMAYWSIGVME